MESLPGLKDKVAIVTGHTRGIGAAIHKLLHEQGVKVFGFDLPDIDLSVTEDIAYEVEAVVKQAGRLDILVNNAGVTTLGNVLETPTEEVDRVLNINLKAPFFMMRAAIPYMLKLKAGSIINICSDQAFVGKQNSSIYGASKAALAQLTRSSALDWAPFGIRVNAIAPGSTDTPMLREVTEELKRRYPKSFPADAEEHYRSTIPLGRFAAPREMAWAVTFLASEASSFITGAVIPVDGGFTAQ